MMPLSPGSIYYGAGIVLRRFLKRVPFLKEAVIRSNDYQWCIAGLSRVFLDESACQELPGPKANL